mgnify:FL=1
MENLSTNLQDGLLIMVLGMGFVFIFLTIMVFIMDWSSKLIIKLNEIFPEEVVEEKYTKKSAAKDDNEVALAIAVAYSKSKI